MVTIDNQKEEQVPEEASKSINELAKEKEKSPISSDSEIMSDKEKAEFLAKIKNL